MKVNMISRLDCALLDALDVRVQKVQQRRPLQVSWKRPRDGWFKLNVDGSCRNNPVSCGGGEVVRNARGKLVLFQLSLVLG